MPQLPHAAAFDSTIAFMRDPYRFVSKECERLKTDAFESRLMLRPTTFLRGAEAAKVFYDTSRFQRSGAMPRRIIHTLLGKGGVQGLDDEAHRHRKRMLLSIAMPPAIDGLGDLSERYWLEAAGEKWRAAGEVALIDAAYDVLFRVACDWAGVPAEAVTERVRNDVVSLIEGAGAVGPRHWRALFGRKRANAWARDLIERTRHGDLSPRPDTALYIISHQSDLAGKSLDLHEAAVELLNLIRPTTAVARYVVFIAHAFHEHPECRERLATDDDGGYVEAFVQEVRRFYPFFPAIAALVRESFEWNGDPFPQGRRVMLDLYGTNHDARLWSEPEAFRPERFLGREIGSFELMPQGGGDHFANHRCAGEWVTLTLMRRAAKLLATVIDYDVPPQDLSLDLRRLPSGPKSGFFIKNVRVRATNE